MKHIENRVFLDSLNLDAKLLRFCKSILPKFKSDVTLTTISPMAGVQFNCQNKDIGVQFSVRTMNEYSLLVIRDWYTVVLDMPKIISTDKSNLKYIFKLVNSYLLEPYSKK